MFSNYLEAIGEVGIVGVNQVLHDVLLFCLSCFKIIVIFNMHQHIHSEITIILFVDIL